MFIHDYHKQAEEVILLLPPMLATAANLKAGIADKIEQEHRYLLPDLSAHGDAAGSEYRSAAQEAAELHDYLVRNGITHLKLAYGASLGGVVLFELLRYGDISYDHIYFEGVSFFESSPIIQMMLTRVFLSKKRKAENSPIEAEKKLVRLYQDMGASMLKQFQGMSVQSVKNAVRDCGHVRLPILSKDIQEKITFAFGEKEMSYKKARKIIPQKYPNATIIAWENMGHCEIITHNPTDYARTIEAVMAHS